jgi:hypothetical protein
MQSRFKLSVLILFLSTAILFISTCKKDEETVPPEDLLEGTWKFGETTIDLTVGGVDLVQYVMDNFGYTQQQADLMVAQFAAAVNDDNEGEITFNEDKTYSVAYDSGDTENGTWAINAEGTELTLTYENETDQLFIRTLTSILLIISLPTEVEYVDFDGDEIEETELTMNGELRLTK